MKIKAKEYRKVINELNKFFRLDTMKSFKDTPKVIIDNETRMVEDLKKKNPELEGLYKECLEVIEKSEFKIAEHKLSEEITCGEETYGILFQIVDKKTGEPYVYDVMFTDKDSALTCLYQLNEELHPLMNKYIEEKKKALDKLCKIIFGDKK